MINYKKVIDAPRLVIQHDTDAESPRKNCDNIGYFLTNDTHYRSPDGNSSNIYQIMIETGNEAANQADHVKRMKARINKETGEKVKAIYPVYKYEHGDVVYRIGEAHGFDYSNNGFYIVTDKTQKLLGTPKKSIKKVIEQELAEYSQWANGDVYGFRLYDKDGNDEDSCWGFYDIEDIREYLPDEFKKENLRDYLKI